MVIPASPRPIHPVTRVCSVALALLLVFAILPRPARAEAADWPIAGGHYFTQTGGFAIADREGIPFWSEFQRLGGVQAVGYPVSQPFQWHGFTVQAMQRVVFQWRPEAGQVYFVNVFDLLHDAGQDDWLHAVRQTPKPLPPSFDAGQPWAEAVRLRLALLDDNPAVRQKYFSVVGDAVTMNGLPTSRVTDMGNHYALRAQRVVFQQWKERMPWAAAGEVTVALGGDIAKELGAFPAAATKGQSAATIAGAMPDPRAKEPAAVAKPAPLPAPAPPSAPSPPAVASAPSILAQINAFRAAAGVPPARIHPALEQAARSHVAYYDANRGDPSLAGMGLHRQTAGRPGFTGASMGDRAKAAGYSGGAVTENAGFGGLGQAVAWHMDTVNHRLPLIHPSAVDLGLAVSEASGFNIIDVGLNRGERITVALPSVYPADGATGVPAAWNGGETPDPAPGLPRPLGYPITVAFAVQQKVEWKSFGLRDPAGNPLPISTPRTDWMRAAAIVPHRPLASGATYTVVVEAVVDGKPVTKEWRFTTGG